MQWTPKDEAKPKIQSVVCRIAPTLRERVEARGRAGRVGG
jgi:hypothetical protein